MAKVDKAQRLLLISSESLKLLNWGFRNTTTYQVAKVGETTFDIKTWLGVSKSIKGETKEDLFVTINKKDVRHLKTIIEYDGPIKAPIKKDQILANLKIYKKDELIKNVKIYATEEVKKVNIFSSLLTSINYLIWGDV